MIADTIIENGRIYTVDSRNPWAEALAIKDGKILYVGTAEKTGLHKGESTRIIDAGGKLILPGFFDNHCHPSCYIYRSNGVQLQNYTSIPEYQEAISRYAKEKPELSIIKGCGWFFSDFDEAGPTKDILDAVVDDRPILLYSGDFHNAWVNSKALELAGVTRDTPNPPGGRIARDEAGNATGYFCEAPAVSFLENCLSGYSAEDFRDGLVQFFKDANRAGITSVRDAGIIHSLGYEGYKLLKEEDFTVRLNMDIIIPPEGGEPPAEKLRLAENTMEEQRCEKISIKTVKLFMDGVCEANTGLLEEPYLNEKDNRGEPMWDLYDFMEICRLADEKGYQIHVHTLGDRAVRYALNGLEYAEERNGKRDARHQLAHVQLLNHDDLERLARLNVLVAPTPLWYEKGGLFYEVELHNLGGCRAEREYPFKSLLNRGVKIACGSDTPVGTAPEVCEIPFAPVLAIQQGITRCAPTMDPEDPKNILNPNERATLEDMIRSFTLDAAYACFSDHETGSLEAGKYADLIMLDQNLYEIDVKDFYKTNVLMTMLGGKVIHQ